MNLYEYYYGPTSVPASVLPENRSLYEKALIRLRQRNLSSELQRKLLEPLTAALSASDHNSRKAYKTFCQELKAIPKNHITEWMDFFSFAAIYIGLYQTLYLCVIEPWLNQVPLSWQMPFGWRLLLETILVYLIFKGLILVLIQYKRTWKRWLFLAILFVLYLAGLYGCSFIQGTVMVSIPLVLVVCALLGGWNYYWNHNYFKFK